MPAWYTDVKAEQIPREAARQHMHRFLQRQVRQLEEAEALGNLRKMAEIAKYVAHKQKSGAVITGIEVKKPDGTSIIHRQLDKRCELIGIYYAST
jgi:hypothetical protein